MLGVFRGVVYEYAVFDRFLLQRDLARVEAFYHTRGYYDAHARAGRVHETSDKHVRVEIVVEEGEPVVVRSVRVDGLADITPQVASAVQKAAMMGLRAGAPLDAEQLEKTERAVRRALTNRGYAYATVKSDVAADVVNHTADAVFSVAVGPECVFGPVTLKGLGGLPEPPVRRAIDIGNG